MSKPWVGYLSSVLLLLAGILMIAGNKTAVGCVFIGVSAISLVLKIFINKK